MNSNSCGSGLVVFSLTLIFGLFSGYCFEYRLHESTFDRKVTQNVIPDVSSKLEGGSGSCGGSNISEDSTCRPGTLYCPKNKEKPEIPVLQKNFVPLKITLLPKPPYTALARQNQIQGVVRLRVTFLGNGKIGDLIPVSGLPDGLLEQCISSARDIKFEPKKLNGVPQTVNKVIEYRFTIY